MPSVWHAKPRAASVSSDENPLVTLAERLREDVKQAMRAGDKARLGTLRMAMASIKQREVDERITLDDARMLAVLEKMVKQRKESIAQFESGGRADLVAKENAEVDRSRE